MSFPTDIQGAEGEQFNTYSTQTQELGQALVLRDGRKFRYVENGAALLIVGNVIQSEAPGANFDELVTAAAAMGAESITVTTGATAITKNQFNQGYLMVEDDAGEGHIYRITEHGATGTTASAEIPIAGSVAVALTSASTTLLLKSQYKDVIIMPTTVTGLVIGVAVAPIAATQFGWVQTHGPAAVLTDGTVVIGQHVRASDGTAGTVEALDRDGSAEDEPEFGWVMSVGATTEHSMVYLTCE